MQWKEVEDSNCLDPASRSNQSSCLIDDLPHKDPYKKLVDLICVGLILSSLFYSTGLYMFLSQNHTLLITVAL